LLQAVCLFTAFLPFSLAELPSFRFHQALKINALNVFVGADEGNFTGFLGAGMFVADHNPIWAPVFRHSDHKRVRAAYPFQWFRRVVVRRHDLLDDFCTDFDSSTKSSV
jgi:hypothetical protein